MEEEKGQALPSRLEYFLGKLNVEEIEELRQTMGGKPKKRDIILVELMDLLLQGTTSDEAVYAQLYPGKAFSYKQVRNLRSELFTRLTDFMTHKRFAESKEKQLYLAKMMNQKQAFRYFPTMMEKMPSNLDKEPESLEDADLQNRLRLEYLEYQGGASGRRHYPLAELIHGTECAWVARMLYYGIVHYESLGRYQDISPEPDTVGWSFLKNALQAGAWADSKVVQLYYALYQLVSEPDSEIHWPRVKAILSGLRPTPGDGETEQVYAIALNHLIRKRNAGDETQLEELFHLYKEMLGHQIIQMDSHQGAWHFKAITSCAINLREFIWARQFIQDHGPQLPEPFGDNLMNYTMGMLEFHEGNFMAAESHMNTVLQNYLDPFIGLDARGYLLRIYYETGNIVGLDSLINSFRLFLRRHRHLSESRLKNYQEFIRFFRRFVVLPAGPSTRSAKLLAEIQASSYHAGKKWFIQKLEAL